MCLKYKMDFTAPPSYNEIYLHKCDLQLKEETL